MIVIIMLSFWSLGRKEGKVNASTQKIFLGGGDGREEITTRKDVKWLLYFQTIVEADIVKYHCSPSDQFGFDSHPLPSPPFPLSFRSNVFSRQLWIISSTRIFLLVPNKFFKLLCLDLILLLNLCYPWSVWSNYTVSWALTQTAKLLCDRNQAVELSINRNGCFVTAE